MTILILLFAAQSAVRVEESARGSDVVERRIAVSRARSHLDAARFHPLDLWSVDPSTWEELFEVSVEAPAGERGLPEGVVDDQGRAQAPLVARRDARTLAAAVERDAGMERLRLVPRDASLRERCSSLVAWKEKESGRLVRVEADCGARRVACTLEEKK